MADAIAPNGENSFWRVDDNLGRDHGTYDRATAADVAERVWNDDPGLQWVQVTLVPPSGSLH